MEPDEQREHALTPDERASQRDAAATARDLRAAGQDEGADHRDDDSLKVDMLSGQWDQEARDRRWARQRDRAGAKQRATDDTNGSAVDRVATADDLRGQLQQALVDQEMERSAADEREGDLDDALNRAQDDRDWGRDDRLAAERDRQQSAADRRDARVDREHAAADRVDARRDREQAEVDRQTRPPEAGSY